MQELENVSIFFLFCIEFIGDFFMRKIKEEILEQNIRNILKTNQLMLVVKDDAYGFGIDRVVPLARRLRVRDQQLERLLRNAGHLLLFHRTQVWLLATMSGN